MTEWDVGQLAQSLREGLLVQFALADLHGDPTMQAFADDWVSSRQHLLPAPGFMLRRDGSSIAFHEPWFLSRASIAAQQQRLVEQCATASLLTLGDALQEESYFDKSPALEFMRHLRNAVAHGNRFTLRPNEPRRPAHFTSAQGDRFEITPASHGTHALFNIMAVGDVSDLLQFISWHLIRAANGDPPNDLFPQRP